GEANESNIENFTNNVFLKKVRVSGGTWYTPAMKAVVEKVESENKEKGFFKKLFGKKDNNGFDKNLPTLVFFMTDGANHWDDREPAKEYLKEISDKPIFWQFVGIGRSSMPFLEALDTMEGRVVDNANFFRAEDIQNIPYSGLLDKILNEYPSWLK
ncbi:VWA domain-containing protein, partial [Bacillus thuringiensis]|uniref:VWA domain-containing protein n=1 Tax=Bacillus thuringiensis TaxID=1428 RepID=UPI0038840749